jgi:hypothetical protein
MKEEKKTVQVTEYTCDFCYGVKSYSKRKVERHEKKCASRPMALTPYEWNSEDRGGDDRYLGEFAEMLVRDGIYKTPNPLHNWETDPSKIEVEYPYRSDSNWQIRDYLEMRAKYAEEIAAIVKSPAFMKEVERRANEYRTRGIQLVMEWAKKVKLEIPKELEDKEDVPKDEELG